MNEVVKNVNSNNEKLKECIKSTEDTLRTINGDFTGSNADKVIKSANNVTRSLGGKPQFDSVDEFKKFLDSDEPFIL